MKKDRTCHNKENCKFIHMSFDELDVFFTEFTPKEIFQNEFDSED